MNNLIKLSNSADENGNVDFIANRTKNNYVNLGGANIRDAIDCVHKFLCYNKVWDENDSVIHTMKPIGYIPNPQTYHNISFILNFYYNAYKELKEKKSRESDKIIHFR